MLFMWETSEEYAMTLRSLQNRFLFTFKFDQTFYFMFKNSILKIQQFHSVFLVT